MALIERQQQQQKLAQKRRQGPEGDLCRLAKNASGEGGRLAVAGGVVLLILLCSAVGFELKSLGSGTPCTRHRRPSPSRPLFDNFVPEKQKKRRERERGRARESKRPKERNRAVIVCVLTWSKK